MCFIPVNVSICISEMILLLYRKKTAAEKPQVIIGHLPLNSLISIYTDATESTLKYKCYNTNHI